MATTIAHTTDLSGDDRAAFVHASGLAAASAARLITVHGNAPATASDRLPDAAPLATAWGRPIAHERLCHECCDDVTDTVLDALRRIAPGLVVTGTHARHGLAALVHGSVGMALARNLDVPTLVVPNRGRRFVDEATGAIDLRRVLIPAGDALQLAQGLAAAAALAELAGATAIERIVLHVGATPLEVPREPNLRVRAATGGLDAAILAAVAAEDPCVIVMTTAGHDGVLDALFGTHTEHIMRDAGCPVLAVPTGWNGRLAPT
ncbi:MAG: universal stress protein [Myxococcales bacterium]|nr:universal stress protein [Myxococcales bacterium]